MSQLLDNYKLCDWKWRVEYTGTSNIFKYFHNTIQIMITHTHKKEPQKTNEHEHM